ncbi:hypothetical protein SAB1456c [Staphylococcus aureus RF122]|nr:hypothetical protein SAB1456c [Staphylococcus aureus RF122]
MGPQHREIGFPISTDNASWGGPQHRSCRKVSLQQCASWRGPNIKKYFFFRNQYFLCMSLTHVILFLSTYYLWLMCKSHYIINH